MDTKPLRTRFRPLAYYARPIRVVQQGLFMLSDPLNEQTPDEMASSCAYILNQLAGLEVESPTLPVAARGQLQELVHQLQSDVWEIAERNGISPNQVEAAQREERTPQFVLSRS